MPLDPSIANIDFAQENPEQQPPQTNITYEKAAPESTTPTPTEGVEVLPGVPTLDEIREANHANGTVSPILDLSAKDLADLATDQPDKFNLEQEFIKFQPQWNKELFDKGAEAYNILEQRGGHLPKDLGASQLFPMAKHAVKGGVSWASGAAKAIFGAPVAAAMEKIDQLTLNRSPELQATATENIRKKALETQREAIETAAATEADITGLAFMAKKAGTKLFGKNPAEKSAQEKKDSFKEALIPHLAQKAITSGESPAIQAIAGTTIKELKGAGLPIRPEAVEEKIAGDPVGFIAFGKGLEGVGAALGVTKGIARAAAKLPVVAPIVSAVKPILTAAGEKIPSVTQVGGKAIQAAGATIEKGAELAAKAAPVAVPIVGAATGAGALSSLGYLAAGALGGLGAVAPLVRPIVAGAKKVAELGAKLKGAGKSIAATTAEEIAEAPVRGAVTQGVKDVLQSIPDSAGQIGHGAALDLGLAAVTSTTPEDQQGLQLGTILGAVQAGRKTAGWVVSGQNIAARPWGSKAAVASSGQLPVFDAMHAAAYSSAPPAVRQRINSVREFLKGVGSDADVFLADPTHVRTAADGAEVNTDIEKALTESGVGATDAEMYAKQSGFFERNLPVAGKPGETRRAIVLATSDAAPHEAKHAFQDVIGEQANQVIDKVIQETYGDELDSIGKDYTEKLIQRKLGPTEDWQDHALEASGEGDAAALLKLRLDAANKISAATGAQATEAEIKPFVPDRLDAGDWKKILTPEEKTAAANKYISREIAAEHFDAIFKNLGASLKEKTGIIPWLARVVAGTTELLGGDSLRGRTSEIVNMPLDAGVVEAIKGQVRGELPAVAPKGEAAAKPVIRPTITTKQTIGTPQEEAAKTADVAAIADENPTGPEPEAQSPKTILETIADAKKKNEAVLLTRRTAPGTPAGAIEITRGNRREQIEAARSIPDDQKPLWEKLFNPIKTVVLKDGSIQEQGWDSRVIAANAEKVASFLAGTDVTKSPFAIDKATGSFTPQGWRDLFQALQIYAFNQQAGLTGKGTPINIGRAAEFGFTEPAGTKEAFGTLTDAEANFINYIVGFPLPGKGPTVSRGGSKQFGVQEISKATEPGRAKPMVTAEGGTRTFESAQAKNLGFAGEPVLEVNPLRAEIEQLGKAPSLIEAWQNLNLRDIVKAEAAPEQPSTRLVGVTSRAGFAPSKNPRAVKTAAVRDDNGAIWEGTWHGDAFMKAQEAPGNRGELEQGFTTNSGEWLTREEALARAVEVKQLTETNREYIAEQAEKFGEKAELESGDFARARAFSPAKERTPIEIEGPDGKKYKVLFDGYQDATAIGLGHIPQVTPLEDIPGVVGARSTTYGTTLEKAGYKLPKDLPQPELEASFAPNADLGRISKEYRNEEKIKTPVRPVVTKFDEGVAKEISDYYDAQPKGVVTPEAREAYDAFNQETKKQYEKLLAEGYSMEPWKGTGAPYKDSAALRADVQDNKHLFYLPSETAIGEGPAPKDIKNYPPLEPSGVTIKGEEVPFNDLFRAVHDIFGHGTEGRTFSMDGEFQAWQDHARMYSEKAQPALALETLGQNAWFNAGKHLRRASGELPKKGEKDFIPLHERGYAPRTIFLFPKSLMEKAVGETKPRVGLEFKKFFSDVTKGTFGKSDKPFEPIVDLSGSEDAIAAKAKHSGNFDDHIAKSIPTFYEDQIKKAKAIVDTFGDGANLLDIAASEGSFGKSISELSDGKIKTVSLDPNPDMAKFFESKSKVPGATYSEDSFLNGFEDAGVEHPAHNPAEPYDVITESMGFQFIDADRAPQIAEAKRLLKPDGVFLTEQKVKNPDWAANEAKKDTDYKSKYFSMDELAQKDTRVGFAQAKDEAKAVGMVNNMVDQSALEKMLTDNFKHVVQYWDSGNFKGYAAGDSAAKIDALVKAMGDNSSEFSTTKLPREVSFAPKKKKAADPLKFLGTQHGEASKAWILPNGNVEQLGAQWHHEWLSEHPEIADRYKLNIPKFEGTDVEGVRGDALKKGFARVNLDNGNLTVEVREKNWNNVKPIVEDIIDKNLDDIDRFRVGLLDETATELNKTLSAKLFDADTDREKMDRTFEALSEEGRTERGAERAFAPSREEIENPETIREALSSSGWAIVTGTQEKIGGVDVPWNDPRNLEANAKLRAELEKSDYDVIPVKGHYKGQPQGESFMVLGMSPYEAQALGKRYNQESVITPKGLLYGDGTITPGRPEDTLLGAEAKKQEFYSTTPDGLSFSIPLDFDKPYQSVGEQSQLFGGREYESPANFTQKELKERYPEAIVPKNSKEKIDSDIVGSPLYKQSDNPVSAFADKLVEFAKQYVSDPIFQTGTRWYSDFTPLLKKAFGADSPMMAELLAASSPNENPKQNFFYAVDALEGFKSGRFNKIIKKYNEGWDLMKSDKWEPWIQKEIKAGNVPKPPETPTKETFLAHWIYKHDLKPKQSNGALYGFHGKSILEVMARKWMENNKGPKTDNFVQNLLGIGHGATIDVWADRTMRRLGYADEKNRWRIMPGNGTGVSDADFAFSQKAFAEAAKRLGMTADSLQGGLWFAEKKLWESNGWGRLDLGSYVDEMANLPFIQANVRQRLKTTALKKKVVPMEQAGLGFELEPRKLK